MEKEIALPNNMVLKIEQDDFPESPRAWDNLGTMACFHGRYDLGDKDIPFDSDDFNGWAEMEEYLENALDVVAKLPIYMYDHSGITINTTGFSCPWDSGQIGFIYVTKEKMIEEYGSVTKKNIENALKVLKAEVENYDQYLVGDIYGFRLLKKTTCDQGHEHEEQIDSCWGFYGSDPKTNGMIEHLPKDVRQALDAL